MIKDVLTSQDEVPRWKGKGRLGCWKTKASGQGIGAGMGGRGFRSLATAPAKREKALPPKCTTPKCLLLFRFSVINPSRW